MVYWFLFVRMEEGTAFQEHLLRRPSPASDRAAARPLWRVGEHAVRLGLLSSEQDCSCSPVPVHLSSSHSHFSPALPWLRNQLVIFVKFSKIPTIPQHVIGSNAGKPIVFLQKVESSSEN